MRVVFMGTPAFAVPPLRALLEGEFEVAGVVSQPDRPAGRGRVSVSPPVAELARIYHVPLIQPSNPHDFSALATLSQWAPDVIVVAAYGVILRSPVLNLPPLGCINIHASLLPRHRGASPIAQAILDGDQWTGVTIICMDEGMDTGSILSQRPIQVEDEDTAGSLGQRLAEVGASLLIETLPAYARGELVPVPQDHAFATLTRPLRKEDGRLNWHDSAIQLWRRVRAMQPWPGAYTLYAGKPLKILQARPIQSEMEIEETPGRIVEIDREPAVVTGDGLLVLQFVQPAGKRPMTGADFARGQRGFIGSRLE